MFIDITIDNKKEKCFIFKNKASEKMNLCSIETTDISLSEEVNFSSIIKTDKTKNLFIKIVPSKHGHKANKSKFFLREVISERLFFNAQTIREYRYSKRLSKLGINTPKVYGAGFFLTEMQRYSGIIIYERLYNQITVQEFILSDETNERKASLLENVSLEYKKMSRKGIHFYDFHLSNVLVNPETLSTYWIDPRLKRLSLF